MRAVFQEKKDTAEHHSRAGRSGMSFASQQMTQRQAQHGGDAAQHHHPEQIALGVAKSVRTGSQKIQQRPAKQKRQQGKHQGRHRSAPDAESRYMPDILMIAFSQHTGYQASAAQTEQISQSGEQVEPGRNQGYCRNHIRIPDLPHKKRIRQIIDHGHHLADDGGNGQRRHRPRHRHGLKQFLLRYFLFQCYTPLLHTLHQDFIDFLPIQLSGIAFDHIAGIRHISQKFGCDLCL